MLKRLVDICLIAAAILFLCDNALTAIPPTPDTGHLLKQQKSRPQQPPKSPGRDDIPVDVAML